MSQTPSAVAQRAGPASGLTFPFTEPPATARWTAITPDLQWVRMPLPFALDHINLWLLRGPHGWTLVDCGFHSKETRAAWDGLLPQHAPLEQIVVTHYHPDHIGQGGWMVREFGVPFHMTEAEYLTAHALYESTSGYDNEGLQTLYRSHGLAADKVELLKQRPTGYRNVITEPPRTFRRIMHGDLLRLGFHEWRVIAGFGHSPEHASLYCAELGLVISGDMLLPKISTNVSVWSTEPEGDPVGQFLRSIRAYEDLPEDTLVLPSHGLPFRGIGPRVAALHAHHDERLADLVAACATPMTAADVVPVLFRRQLDTHQLFFAMGESIAHLNHLLTRGRVERTKGADGAYRFTARPA